MAPLHAEEVGVTPHRLAAAGKRRHRQIPTDRHRDRQRLARLELALHGQGRAEVILTATAPVVIAVGDGAIGREAAPEFAAIPGWIPAAAALDADAGLILCGDAPLTLTLGNGRGAVAFEKDAAEHSLIDAAIALPLGAGDGRDIVVLRLPSSRKCTSAEASVLGTNRWCCASSTAATDQGVGRWGYAGSRRTPPPGNWCADNRQEGSG